MSTETIVVWLTVLQAAVRAQVGKRVIYEAVERRQLRAARVGGKRALRFRPEWIDAWLEASATPVEIPR
jgi:excisionase family DNA binding protein